MLIFKNHLFSSAWPNFAHMPSPEGRSDGSVVSLPSTTIPSLFYALWERNCFLCLKLWSWAEMDLNPGPGTCVLSRLGPLLNPSESLVFLHIGCERCLLLLYSHHCPPPNAHLTMTEYCSSALNNMEIRGTNPPCYWKCASRLQSLLCRHSSFISTDSAKPGLCHRVVFTIEIYWKSANKWTHAVQTHVVQESAVFGNSLACSPVIQKQVPPSLPAIQHVQCQSS